MSAENAISQMEGNKDAARDRFLMEFYQRFWEVIKKVLMSLFVHLQIAN
jgi:hypothetical protein